MRWLWCLIFVPAVAVSARADQASDAQVEAATLSALNNLQMDVRAEAITPGITVADLVAKTNSWQQLNEVLRQATQIGGPRWVDEHTCQVRLDMPGRTIAVELAKIAADNPRTSPLSPREVSTALWGWNDRVFSVTGTSIKRLDDVHPPASVEQWRDVSDKDVRNVVNAAKQDAVTHVLDSIGTVPLAEDKKISDALAIGAVAQSLAQWLGDRPVTQVNFRTDRVVEVTLSVSAGELCAKLQALLAGQAQFPRVDDKAWSAVVDRVSHQMATPMGQAQLNSGTAAVVVAAVALPAQPPEWVDRELDASGDAAGGAPLAAAHNAEGQAMKSLREQANRLSLGNGKTLRDLADSDARMASAVDRAISRGSHVYRVNYKPDGSVSVRMSLDLRDLWAALDASR